MRIDSFDVQSVRDGKPWAWLMGMALLLGACTATPPGGEPQTQGARQAPLQMEATDSGPTTFPLQRAALAQADDTAADGFDETYDDEELFGFTEQERQGDGDPLETLNRFTFAFNDMLDTLFLRPAAYTYRELLPLGVRNAVRSFLRNLSTPVILMNDLLQGDGDRALNTSKRFFVNTAFSLGFYDYAKELDLPYYEADFGQTLATYGAGEGFYLVLPVFGPSSLRDATGSLVDNLLDPLTYVMAGDDGRLMSAGRAGTSGVDTRSRNIEALDQALADSLDDYIRIRSLWRQVREQQIQKRESLDESDPDFGTGPLPQL